MLATFLVIGMNHRTAAPAMRDRFWIAEPRRYEALVQLRASEGIEEAVVLATCNRTEFILWVSDVAEGSNSVLAFLTREYGLRLCEWQKFYRKLDEAAVEHVFRVASGLDSRVLGEAEVETHVMAACRQAQTIGSSGRMLDSLFAHATLVSRRVRASGGGAADEIIEQEVARFTGKLRTMESVAPFGALRSRLHDLVRLELEQVRQKAGTLPTEHEQWMQTLATRIAERISTVMAWQLNQVEHQDEQHQLTAAIQRLLQAERRRPAAVAQKN